MFKVGDVVIGKILTPYSYTTDKAVMDVTRVEPHRIWVRIKEHADYPREIGCEYDVDPDYFELAEPPEDDKAIVKLIDRSLENVLLERLPTNVPSLPYEIRWTTDGLQIGCQKIEVKDALLIAKHIQEVYGEQNERGMAQPKIVFNMWQRVFAHRN